MRKHRRYAGGSTKEVRLMEDYDYYDHPCHPTSAPANPFAQTVEEQINALREMNQFWKNNDHPFIEDIDEVCKRLIETAPAWPEGEDAYRSLRIRFGEGRDGVVRTFEAHAEAVKRAHNHFWRWELLHSGEHPYQDKPVDRLRLLNGNDTHKSVVEWIIIHDLSAHQKRESLTAVRGEKSLADEGLVLAWLVPDRVRAIDYDFPNSIPFYHEGARYTYRNRTWCAWICAGYEVNVPEDDYDSWQVVVIVGYDFGRTLLCCNDCSGGHSDAPDYSVPTAR